MTPHDWNQDASLYVAGLLSREDTVEFELQLRGGSPEVIGALASAAGAVSVFAWDLPPVSPPPALKSRLMNRIAQGHPPGLGALLSHEGEWRETGVAGVTYKRLYHDRDANLVTNLVRMAPGAVYPAHIHAKTEQCLVIEGDLLHDGHVYGPGDFTWAEGGTVDPALHTRTGNLLLIISARENKTVSV